MAGVRAARELIDESTLAAAGVDQEVLELLEPAEMDSELGVAEPRVLADLAPGEAHPALVDAFSLRARGDGLVDLLKKAPRLGWELVQAMAEHDRRELAGASVRWYLRRDNTSYGTSACSRRRRRIARAWCPSGSSSSFSLSRSRSTMRRG